MTKMPEPTHSPGDDCDGGSDCPWLQDRTHDDPAPFKRGNSILVDGWAGGTVVSVIDGDVHYRHADGEIYRARLFRVTRA